VTNPGDEIRVSTVWCRVLLKDDTSC